MVKTKIKYTLVIDQEIEVETPLPLPTTKSLRHELKKIPIEKHIINGKVKAYDFACVKKVSQRESE